MLCEHGLEIGKCTCTADHCSKCGGEYDAEGWCANYCEDDEPANEESSVRKDKDK